MYQPSIFRTLGAAALVAVSLAGCSSLTGKVAEAPQPTTASVDYGSYGPQQPNSGFTTSGAVIADAGGGVFGTTDQITVDSSGPFPNNDPAFDGSLSDLSADDQALLAGTGLDFAAESRASAALSFPGDDGSQRFFDADIGTTIYFATNSTSLSEDARDTLRKQAAWLNVHPEVSATVEGHTDERGTRQFNIALGERRASAVRGYLTALGVSGDRVRKVSYGREQPAVPGSTEAAWSRNRRAVTVLSGSSGARPAAPLPTPTAPLGDSSVQDLLNDPLLNDLPAGDPLLNDPLLNDPLLNDV